jgi:hypothetical protein
MDYQTFLESIGCAPAQAKRMVENRPRHTFGDFAVEYNPATDEDEETATED